MTRYIAIEGGHVLSIGDVDAQRRFSRACSEIGRSIRVQQNTSVLTALFDSGFVPTACDAIEAVYDIVRARRVELLNHLFDVGVDPNLRMPRFPWHLLDVAIGTRDVQLVRMIGERGGRSVESSDGYFPYGYMLLNRYTRDMIETCARFIEVPWSTIWYVFELGNAYIWMIPAYFARPFALELRTHVCTRNVRTELKYMPPMRQFGFVGGSEYRRAFERFTLTYEKSVLS